jgi:hypothetical protein
MVTDAKLSSEDLWHIRSRVSKLVREQEREK